MPNEYPANEYPTAEYQTLPVPENDYIDDDDEEWVSQAPTGLRIPPVTGILLLVLFAVCGLWGGAVLQKHHDKSTATSTGAAAFAAAAAGRRAGGAGLGTGGAGATGVGAAGAGGAGAGGAGATGAGGGRTLGTVTDVEGSTVYLTDASGNIVKVNLAPATKITKSTSGTVADIQLGQTVIVSGAKGTDGSTTAAAISIAPAGTGAAGAAGAAGGTGATGRPGAAPATGGGG